MSNKHSFLPGSPPMYYSQHVQDHGQGSLGTPHYPNVSPSGSYGSSNIRQRRSSKNLQSGMGGAEIILTPTRPVLKALARVCRCPPWSVGYQQSSNLDNEMNCFGKFLSRTPEEQKMLDEMYNTIAYKSISVWPNAKTLSCNAQYLGLHIPSSILELVIMNTDEDVENIKKNCQCLNDAGFSCETVVNSRGTSSLRLVEARGGERLLVHLGRTAEDISLATEKLNNLVSSQPNVRSAVQAVYTVIRQSKYSDETGDSGGISYEVVIIMMVSLLSKYNGIPTSGRLLLDFFITYGWHFESQKNAVQWDYKIEDGGQWPVKTHNEHQLEVRDPISSERNIASMVSKFPQIRSLFQYCYMQLNQWETVSSESRAQSQLSTIIGGEAFWGRIIFLTHHGIEPYASFVNDKKQFMRL